MEKEITCYALTGPTASGKSELAMRLAAEDSMDILCMDSMQIYRGMAIGTAKPTPEDRATVPHHLLDLCEPTETYSVSQYVECAENLIEKLHSEGRKILFVGGTVLYLEGLIRGHQFGSVPANSLLREKMHHLASEPDGKQLLDQYLRKLDPETADRLPLNDLRRRIRAIEVTEATGIPFSRQENRGAGSRFHWVIASTRVERDRLYDRINHRVDRMMASGLRKEVKKLLEEGVPVGAQSMQAIGYKELIPCILGNYPEEAAAEEIRKRSRHYAKRQMTFLRRIETIHYVSPEEPDALRTIQKIFRNNGDESI